MRVYLFFIFLLFCLCVESIVSGIDRTKPETYQVLQRTAHTLRSLLREQDASQRNVDISTQVTEEKWEEERVVDSYVNLFDYSFNYQYHQYKFNNRTVDASELDGLYLYLSYFVHFGLDENVLNDLKSEDKFAWDVEDTDISGRVDMVFTTLTQKNLFSQERCSLKYRPVPFFGGNPLLLDGSNDSGRGHSSMKYSPHSENRMNQQNIHLQDVVNNWLPHALKLYPTSVFSVWDVRIGEWYGGDLRVYSLLRWTAKNEYSYRSDAAHCIIGVFLASMIYFHVVGYYTATKESKDTALDAYTILGTTTRRVAILQLLCGQYLFIWVVHILYPEHSYGLQQYVQGDTVELQHIMLSTAFFLAGLVDLIYAYLLPRKGEQVSDVQRMKNMYSEDVPNSSKSFKYTLLYVQRKRLLVQLPLFTHIAYSLVGLNLFFHPQHGANGVFQHQLMGVCIWIGCTCNYLTKTALSPFSWVRYKLNPVKQWSSDKIEQVTRYLCMTSIVSFTILAIMLIGYSEEFEPMHYQHVSACFGETGVVAVSAVSMAISVCILLYIFVTMFMSQYTQEIEEMSTMPIDSSINIPVNKDNNNNEMSINNDIDHNDISTNNNNNNTDSEVTNITSDMNHSTTEDILTTTTSRNMEITETAAT